jgi:hypothetical protein
MSDLVRKHLPPWSRSASGRVLRGRVDSMFYSDGMVVTFDEPCRSIGRHDVLRIRTPDGDLLDIIVASVHGEGEVSVWYAPDPLLRHWLGRLVNIDDVRWRFRMEPYHVDILDSIPKWPGAAG